MNSILKKIWAGQSVLRILMNQGFRSETLRGVVLDVHPAGSHGISDRHGVLEIQLQSGDVIYRAASDWITA